MELLLQLLCITGPISITNSATPTIEDIKNLTETEARDIYLAMYIESPAFDVLPSIAMQEAIIDAGINHGIGTATTFLQYALNALGEHLTVDGVIGPKTLTAANKYPSESNYYFDASRAC